MAGDGSQVQKPKSCRGLPANANNVVVRLLLCTRAFPPDLCTRPAIVVRPVAHLVAHWQAQWTPPQSSFQVHSKFLSPYTLKVFGYRAGSIHFASSLYVTFTALDISGLVTSFHHVHFLQVAILSSQVLSIFTRNSCLLPLLHNTAVLPDPVLLSGWAIAIVIFQGPLFHSK